MLTLVPKCAACEGSAVENHGTKQRPLCHSCARAEGADFCYCCARSIGRYEGGTLAVNYRIHRDGFCIGPQVPLCDACGSEELPTCEQIWERIKARGATA